MEERSFIFFEYVFNYIPSRLPFYEIFNKVEIPAQVCPETPGRGASL